jgi:hypothetical protein
MKAEEEAEARRKLHNLYSMYMATEAQMAIRKMQKTAERQPLSLKSLARRIALLEVAMSA